MLSVGWTPSCPLKQSVRPDEGSDFLGGPFYTITCDAVPQPQGATLSWDAGCDFLGGPIGSAVESRLLWPGELPTCNMISESHDCLARSSSATCGPDAAGELCELPLGKNSHTQPGIGTREPRKKDKQPGTGAPEPEKTDKRARAPSAAECAAIADAAALLTGPSLGPRSSWSIARCAMEQRCLGRSLSEAVPYAMRSKEAQRTKAEILPLPGPGMVFWVLGFLSDLSLSAWTHHPQASVCHLPCAMIPTLVCALVKQVRPEPLPLWFRPFPVGFRCGVPVCTLRCQVGCYAQASLNLDSSEVSCRPARAHYNVASQGCAAVGSECLTGSMAPTQANLPRPQPAAMPYSYATCAYFSRYAAAPEVRGDAGREHPQGSGISSTPKPPAAQNCPQPVRYFTTVHLPHGVAAPEVRGDAGHECPPGPGTSSTPQSPAAQTSLLDATSPLRARAGPLPSRFRPCSLVFRCRVPVCQLRCLVASDARFSASRPACEVVSRNHINRSLELEALGSASVGRVCSKGSNMSSEATPLFPQPIGHVTTVHLPCCAAAPEVRGDAGRERLQGPGIYSVPRPPAAQLSPLDVPPLPSARAAPVPLWFWPRPLGFRCRFLVCQSRCQVSTAQLRSNRTACEVSVDHVSCPLELEVLSCASVGGPSTARHDPHAGERIGEASNPGPRPVPCPFGLGLSLLGLGAGFAGALSNARQIAMPSPVPIMMYPR